jgi:hypothetical protein
MDALRTPEDRFENLADFAFKPNYISDLRAMKDSGRLISMRVL